MISFSSLFLVLESPTFASGGLLSVSSFYDQWCCLQQMQQHVGENTDSYNDDCIWDGCIWEHFAACCVGECKLHRLSAFCHCQIASTVLCPAFKNVDAHARVKLKCSLKPYDVSCHELCPRRQENDWDNLIKYHNCSQKYEWSTFHCAKNKSGIFVEACAKPVVCHKGEEPILHFEKENKVYANVKCESCSDDRFNPAEAMKSDEYSVCPYARRNCRSYYGQVECDKVAGEKRTWTDSKCRCDITKNWLPETIGPNNCTADHDLRCYEYPPCPDIMDGRKQEYMYTFSSSEYTCLPKCGDGYHPRTLDRDQCIPIVKSNDTSENSTSTTVATSTSTQAAVKNVTQTVLTPSEETKNATETPTKGSDASTVGYWVGGGVGAVLVIYLGIGVCYYFRVFKKDKETEKGCCGLITSVTMIFCWYRYKKRLNRRGPAQDDCELAELNSQGQSLGVDIPSSIPESGDNTNHHEPGATSQDSQGQSLRVDIPSSEPESGDNTDHNEPGATSQDSQEQSTHVDVHSSPALSENDTDLNEPGATRQGSQGQSSHVAIQSSAPESGDNTDHNERGETSQNSQEQSTRVDVHSSPTLSENDTDQNEQGATRRDSQGQSSQFDVLSSAPVNGDNTDHNEPGATSQNSQSKLDWIETLPGAIKERKLTGTDLSTIPSNIGKNWEELAYKMGLSPVDVDHITTDNDTKYKRIHRAIHTWTTNNINSCTVENFLKILKDCSSTTIECQKLKTFFENLSDGNSS